MCYGMVILTPMEEGSTLFGCLDQNGEGRQAGPSMA